MKWTWMAGIKVMLSQTNCCRGTVLPGSDSWLVLAIVPRRKLAAAHCRDFGPAVMQPDRRTLPVSHTRASSRTRSLHQVSCYSSLVPLRVRGWYQIILLGDRGTCLLTTCPGCPRQRGGLYWHLWPTDCKSCTLPLCHWATVAPLCILLELRTMEVVVTKGNIRHAKLQWNRRHQQTIIRLFTGWMPFLSPNQEHLREKYHSTDLLTPSSPGIFQPCLNH